MRLKIGFHLRAVAAAAVFVPLFAGCGGGGGDGGSAGDVSSYSLNFTQFGADSTSLVVAGTGQADTTVTFSWQATRGGGLPNYALDVYLVPASTPNAVRDDGNRILGTGCGSGNLPCDATGSVTCTYSNGTSNAKPRQTICLGAPQPRRLEFSPGQYVAVARACYFTAAPLVQETCSERTVNMTLN